MSLSLSQLHSIFLIVPLPFSPSLLQYTRFLLSSFPHSPTPRAPSAQTIFFLNSLYLPLLHQSSWDPLLSVLWIPGSNSSVIYQKMFYTVYIHTFLLRFHRIFRILRFRFSSNFYQFLLNFYQFLCRIFSYILPSTILGP